MRELSIFVDESGDLGEVSEYYLVSMVFHDQDDDISSRIGRYEQSLRDRELPDVTLHVGPLINGHDDYRLLSTAERSSMLACFRTFSQHLPFLYRTFWYRKAEFSDDAGRLALAMKRDVTMFLFNHLEWFQAFDRIKIYYDNGQPIVTDVLHDAIGYVVARNATVYRDVNPSNYRLFQLADYACSVELTALKYQAHEQTRTDEIFFGTWRTFKKNFLQKLRAHRMD